MVVEVLLLSFLMSCAMTSLGVAVASRMRSMQGFQMIMNFLVMPLYFLSGAIFPIPSDESWVWMRRLMMAGPADLRRGRLADRRCSGRRASWIRDSSCSTPGWTWRVMAATAVVLALFAGWRFSTAD